MKLEDLNLDPGDAVLVIDHLTPKNCFLARGQESDELSTAEILGASLLIQILFSDSEWEGQQAGWLYHMIPYVEQNEKAVRFLREKMGDTLYDRIVEKSREAPDGIGSWKRVIPE